MQGKLLIVDDCQVNIDILVELLGDDFELETAMSGEQCLEKMPRFNPDLLLLDIMMPGMDGYETCRKIKESPVGPFTQVIMVSGKASPEERLKGYQVGADDYLVKPFNHDELLAKFKIHMRLQNSMAEIWTANSKIREFNQELEHVVSERTTEVMATRDIAVFALAKLAESRDSETGEHLERIRNYGRILAEELSRDGPYSSQIDSTFVDNVYRSSPLHDIGKVGIPDAILLKPGRLTVNEFETMKQHAAIGAKALKEVIEQGTCGQFFEMATDIAQFHHEHFDGSGYPDGLCGTDIPLSARIVALADVFDALTSPRVYKPAFTPEIARQMIENEAGSHFDPIVVEAFLTRFDEFLQICQIDKRRDLEMACAGASEDARR